MKYQTNRVGELIRRRRKEMGFKTQGALAEAIGADQPTVARWETGVYSPSTDYLDKLCEVLKVTRSYFLEDTGIRGDLYPKSRVGTESYVREANVAQDHVIGELFKRIDALEEAQRAGGASLRITQLQQRLEEAESILNQIDPDLLGALMTATPRQLEIVKLALKVHPAQLAQEKAKAAGHPSKKAKAR